MYVIIIKFTPITVPRDITRIYNNTFYPSVRYPETSKINQLGDFEKLKSLQDSDFDNQNRNYYQFCIIEIKMKIILKSRDFENHFKNNFQIASFFFLLYIMISFE